MLFYFIFFCFLILSLFLSAYNKKHSNISLPIFFIVIFIVAGLRGDVGQDTYSYQLHYDSLVDFNDFLFIVSQKEPFLYLLMYPHKLIFNSYTYFLVTIALIQVFLLSYAVRNLYHRSLFLFFYIMIFFLEFHFNVIRVSFSALFYLCCLSVIDNSKKKALIFIFLSVFSHLSILVLMPVIISKLNINLKSLIYLTLGTFIILPLVYFFFSDVIIYKLEAYELFNFSNFRIPILVLLILFIVWISFFLSKKLSSPIKYSLILFSFFFFFSAFSDIAYRFYMISFLSLLFLVFEKKTIDINHLKIKPFVLGTLVLSLWISSSVLYNVSTERMRRIETGVGNPEFSYTPYSFFYDSKYR